MVKGVCTHFCITPLEVVKEDCKQIIDLGYNAVREPLYWNLTNQPTPGRFDFDRYLWIADIVEQSGLLVLWTLAYGNNYLYPAKDDKVAPNPNDPALARWYRMCDALFGIRNNCFALGCYNEPNLETYFKPSVNPIQYGQICNVFAENIRNAPIMFGSTANRAGTVTMDKEFIEAYWRVLNRKPDFISNHNYAGTLHQRELDIAWLQEKIVGPGVDVDSRVVIDEDGKTLYRSTAADVRGYLKDRHELYEKLGVSYFDYNWDNPNAGSQVEVGYSIKKLIAIPARTGAAG